MPAIAAGGEKKMGRRVDLIVERKSEGGWRESALKEKGNGREPTIGQIKPPTKDIWTPKEISMA